MNNTLIAKPSALVVMASRLSVEPDKLLKTLKDTVFKGASDSELIALTVVSNEYGLNPILREIYAFPAKGGGITPVVSIDGWISMVNRQPQLDGLEFEMDEDKGKPVSCTCTIYVKNRTHPVRVTEYYEECFRNTEPWQKMPRRMLRHKSLKEAARIAFGFSGISDEDEAKDIKKANVVEIRRAVTKPTFSNELVPENHVVKGDSLGESKAASSQETSGHDAALPNVTDAARGVGPDENFMGVDKDDAEWLLGKGAK